MNAPKETTSEVMMPLAPQQTDTVVKIEHLSKTYGDFTAVQKLDLELARGEIIGLLGPNGAGKTTTIDMVVGLQAPSAGTVRVFGLDPWHDREEFTRRVAVQTQEASLFESLTVAETLRLFASLHANPLSVAEVAQSTGMTEQAGVRVRKLSGGQKRRLLLAVALVGNPELIVLDEPSAGLDPAARQQLWEVIRALRGRGTTVLLTTHHMDEATELCDRVAIMVDGQVLALDTPENLVLDQASKRKVGFTVAADTNLDSLEALAEVTSVRQRPVGAGLRVTVETNDSDAVLGFIAAQPTLAAHDLTIDGGNLEDVFLQLAATSNYATRTSSKPRRKKFGRSTR